METSYIRISRVLKDLGIGFGTAIKCLEAHGYLDISPISKLDKNAVQLLYHHVNRKYELDPKTLSAAFVNVPTAYQLREEIDLPTGHLVTSRFGKLDSVTVYRYNFTDRTKNNPLAKSSLLKWLTSNRGILLLKLEKDYFLTFNKLESNVQYVAHDEKHLEFPFYNTQLLSLYLATLIKSYYRSRFVQYLDKNIFITTRKELPPFTVLQCFSFDVEMFVDGRFYIHYQPVSKIVGSGRIDSTFLAILQKGTNATEGEELLDFSLMDSDNRWRERFNLFDSKSLTDAQVFIQGCEERKQLVVATFDYKFLNNFSGELFNSVSQTTSIGLFDAVKMLFPVISMLELPDFVQLHDSPYYRIPHPHRIVLDKNLMLGSGFDAREQTAAYHNGMFRPALGVMIQPIEMGGDYVQSFIPLLERFNVGGYAELLPAIKLENGNDWPLEHLKQLKKRFGNRLLLTLFLRNHQPDDFLNPLKKLKVQFQVYCGSSQKFQMSNYTVKCLEKMGGLLSALKCSFERETTYFLGIDMGHSSSADKRYSNLCVTVFDYKGECHVHKTIKNIPLNEALNHKAFQLAMEQIVEFISMEGLPFPEKFIVHRDGRVHQKDVETIKAVFLETAELTEFDVVEIIKSGYPIFAVSDGEQIENPKPGEYWLIGSWRYAILATNIQANDRGQAIKPLVIRHTAGNTQFTKLIEQVYWFTRVYTNNLYYSTRLPATTEMANNRAGTGEHLHTSTYLA